MNYEEQAYRIDRYLLLGDSVWSEVVGFASF